MAINVTVSYSGPGPITINDPANPSQTLEAVAGGNYIVIDTSGLPLATAQVLTSLGEDVIADIKAGSLTLPEVEKLLVDLAPLAGSQVASIVTLLPEVVSIVEGSSPAWIKALEVASLLASVI